MIVSFKAAEHNKDIVFCFVDYTWEYKSGWTRELIKNQSDYTITNITTKGYTVLQGLNENLLLKEAAKNYKFAVVFSTGTEFINGNSFFEEIEKECTSNFVVKGHILNRGNAYYELHRQCYLVNLENFCNLGQPIIGEQSLGESHTQVKPLASDKNIHGDYTPRSITQGTSKTKYMHKMHGWNIISVTLHRYDISAFSEKIRASKKHLYPENQSKFLEHSDWIYKRENYCSENFVHKTSTDWSNGKLEGVQQVVSPASGIWWDEYITDDCDVLLYDYNQKSISYWQKQKPKYNYVMCDLLCDLLDLSSLDANKKTLINLSNIYAYEGTSFTHSLEKRLQKEKEMLDYIKKILPNSIISFSARACSGFIDCDYFGSANSIKTYTVHDLKCPTWHSNGDWC